MSIDEIVVTDSTEVLSYDGSGFDANQVRYPTMLFVDGTFYLYYAGLGTGNFHSIGLATSEDGINFIRVSDDPVVSRFDAPDWASVRIVPRTVMYEDGVFKMWFWGNDTNSFGDSANSHGFGYATSTDRVNWAIYEDPIRIEDGAREGARLIEVVKHGDQYIAYYSDQNLGEPSTLIRAISDDGINFTDDQVVQFEGDFSGFRALTTVGETIIGLSSDGTEGQIFISEDGLNFSLLASITLPELFIPHEIIIEGNILKIVADKIIVLPGVDKVVVEIATLEHDLGLGGTSISDGFRSPLGSEDTILLTEARDDTDDWNTEANDFLDTNSNGRLHLGEDWNYKDGEDSELNEGVNNSVYAISNGEIVHIELGDAENTFGNLIVIRHILPSGEYGGEIYSLYAHLDNIDTDLEVGGFVALGDIIGEVGRTGVSSDEFAHLHFEMFYGDYENAIAAFAYEPKNEVEIFDTPGVPTQAIAENIEGVVWIDPSAFIAGHTTLDSVSSPPELDAYTTDGKDLISGTDSNDFIEGADGKDILLGLAGDDEIDGGDGKDFIDGGSGNDLLTGGDGRDTFFFDLDSDNDTIEDFLIGKDEIDLSAFGFSSTNDFAISDNGFGGAIVTLSATVTINFLNVAADDLEAAPDTFIL